MRKLICGVCALLLCVGVMIADEIKGKVKAIEDTKITVTVGDKDSTYTITDDTKIVRGDKDVKDRKKTIGNLSKAVGDGKSPEVTLTVEKKDGKDVLTQIKLGGGKKKDKN
jgi:hypothetical protein